MKNFKYILFNYILPIFLISSFFIPFLVFKETNSNGAEFILHYLSPMNLITKFPLNIAVFIYLTTTIVFFILNIIKDNEKIMLFRRLNILLAFILFTVGFLIANMQNINFITITVNLLLFVSYIAVIINEFVNKRLD